jgi:hypothetical protein
MNRIDKERQAKIIAALVEGNSPRATARARRGSAATRNRGIAPAERIEVELGPREWQRGCRGSRRGMLAVATQVVLIRGVAAYLPQP